MEKAIDKPQNPRDFSSKKQKESKSAISINLKELMSRANIGEHELSRRTNVKQPVIHRLLSGENTNPKLETLRPIADYFMITVGELIGEKQIDKSWPTLTSGAHHGLTEIPIIPWDKATSLQNVDDKNDKFIVTDCIVSNSAFALTINDTSNEPIFPKGCILVIEPQIYPEDGDYAIIKDKNGDLSIKKAIHIAKNIYLASLNNSKEKFDKLSSKNDIIGIVIRTIYDHRSANKR